MAYIRKRFPRAEIYGLTRTFTEGNQRRVFPGVICAGVRRIVSVIGGNDQEIVRTHRGFDLGPARIEMFQRARIAFSVAAMTVKHVEVNQVREN